MVHVNHDPALHHGIRLLYTTSTFCDDANYVSFPALSALVNQYPLARP